MLHVSWLQTLRHVLSQECARVPVLPPYFVVGYEDKLCLVIFPFSHKSPSWTMI